MEAVSPSDLASAGLWHHLSCTVFASIHPLLKSLTSKYPGGCLLCARYSSRAGDTEINRRVKKKVSDPSEAYVPIKEIIQ